MLNFFSKALSLVTLALTLALSGPAFAQSPTQTTTSTTLTATMQPTDQVLYVASLTGISAAGSLNQPVTALFIDNEYMTVTATAVLGTLNQVSVARQRGLTKAHYSGSTVWIGNPQNFRPHLESGYCNPTTQIGLPAIYMNTGDGYTCPSVGPRADIWSRSFDGHPYQLNDTEFFVPASACQEHASASAGSGDGTYIVDGSVPALKGASTAAASQVYTCTFTVPAMRTTAGKGFQIYAIGYNYSVQTTTATSMTASTLKSFTAPVAAASETASSATLVTAGGTLTQVPLVASANLAAVSAGQYYNELVNLGSPILVNNDQQVFVFTFALAQSASATMVTTCPGIWVYGYSVPL